ncbi:MAG: endonuclease/exonuclease/phosphatase family protein [Bacteroidaceae bacterium]
MKKLFGFIRMVILLTNIFFAVAMVVSAFSPYIPPNRFPFLSGLGIVFPIFLLIMVFFSLFWLVFYRKLIWISLLTLLICSVQIRTVLPINLPKAAPKDAIKILSYNSMAMQSQKKPTRRSPNSVLQYMQESKADIIFIQEFITSKNKQYLQKREVDSVLKAYTYKNYLRCGTQTVNGLACYSKYPILSSRLIAYDSKYNGGTISEIKINNDTIVCINNHLESNKLTRKDRALYKDIIIHPEAQKTSLISQRLIKKLGEATVIRAKQADLMAHLIDSVLQKNRPLVVCGDFNDTPISYTYRTASKQLHDAFVRTGNGLGISYNQSGFYFRIDNILYSDHFKAYNCVIDRKPEGSDHYPIKCALQLNN